MLICMTVAFSWNQMLVVEDFIRSVATLAHIQDYWYSTAYSMINDNNTGCIIQRAQQTDYI